MQDPEPQVDTTTAPARPVRPRRRVHYMAATGAGGRPDYERLVSRVRDGDAQAWDDLVDALKRVAWRVIVSIGLDDHDGKDAFAATFCRLVEHLDDIHTPTHLPGWIATTARHEAYAVLRSRARTTPVEDLGRDDPTPHTAPPDEGILDEELLRAAMAAISRLSPSERELLVLLTTDPPLSYDEISEQLDIKRGGIGPTRQRILAKLRRMPELVPFLEGDDHAI